MQKFVQGLHGLSVKPCHPKKSIDGVAIGAAKRLKQIYPNDSDFQLTWQHVIISQSRVFEKTNNQPGPTVQQKRAKSKTKPVIFTTQYKLLGPNINSIIKKHLLIITNNPSLVEMFPNDSMFCACKRFPNIKNLMVHADPQSIKPLKEIDQGPSCSDCMKRCKNFVDHVSSFECFATKKFLTLEGMSHEPHQVLFTQRIGQNLAKKALDQLKIGNLDFLIINHA